MTISGIGQVHTNTTAFGQNENYRGIAWRAFHAPEYYLYVFNVSARSFHTFGKLTNSSGTPAIPGVTAEDSNVVLERGGAKGKLANHRCHYVTSFPQPVLLSKGNDDSNELESVPCDVRRYVVDLINPDNLGLTLDTNIPLQSRISIGNDLSQKGVFFSYTNPPAREDAEKAIAKMEKYYTALLEEAETLNLTDKVQLSERLRGNPDYAYAADYYGKDVAWHKKPERPVECANCGENKPAGRKFHVTSFGSLCVEQSVEAWKSVVNSGVKQYSEVPDDFKWKKESVTPVSEPVTPPTESRGRNS